MKPVIVLHPLIHKVIIKREESTLALKRNPGRDIWHRGCEGRMETESFQTKLLEERTTEKGKGPSVRARRLRPEAPPSSPPARQDASLMVACQISIDCPYSVKPSQYAPKMRKSDSSGCWTAVAVPALTAWALRRELLSQPLLPCCPPASWERTMTPLTNQTDILVGFFSEPGCHQEDFVGSLEKQNDILKQKLVFLLG